MVQLAYLFALIHHVDPNPFAHLYWWIEVHFGITEKAPPAYYLAWSGVLSDVGEVTLVTGGFLALRHVNCRERHCWRLGHPVPGSGVRSCHKHHPTDPRPKRSGSVAEMHEARK